MQIFWQKPPLSYPQRRKKKKAYEKKCETKNERKESFSQVKIKKATE